jgi:methyl-accepting chemotaxis protein
MSYKVKEGEMQAITINRRRSYYIKRDFQKRFILEYIFLVLVCIVLANWMLYTLLDRGIDNAFYRAHISISTTGDIVRSPLSLTAMVMVASIAVSVLISTSLKTRRVGTRLRSLAEGLMGLRNGDLTVSIEGCQDEDLAELADIFNKAVRRLNKRVSSIEEGITGMEAAVTAFKAGEVDAIERLLKEVESVERGLSAFKLRQ